MWLGASWGAAGAIVCEAMEQPGLLFCSLQISNFIVRGVGIAMKCLCLWWLDGKGKTRLGVWEWLSQRGGGSWESGEGLSGGELAK